MDGTLDKEIFGDMDFDIENSDGTCTTFKNLAHCCYCLDKLIYFANKGHDLSLEQINQLKSELDLITLKLLGVCECMRTHSDAQGNLDCGPENIDENEKGFFCMCYCYPNISGDKCVCVWPKKKQ